MIEYALNKRYSKFIFHRVKKLGSTIYFDKLANNFLVSYTQSNNHKEKRRFAYYLNHITSNCSSNIRLNIITFFLNSGKRYLRKYAYKRNLEIYDLFNLAWSIVNKYHDEATYLIHTIAYDYDDGFITKYFNEIIIHPGIEEYQIRKLFTRHTSLSEENWLWLKEYFPHSFLYLAANNKYEISDEDCIKITSIQTISDELELSTNKSIPDIGLTLWCLGKMRKWKVITRVIESHQAIPLRD